MKKVFFILFTFIILFINSDFLKANCTNDKNLAKNVKYTEEVINTEEELNLLYKVSGIKDDLYIVVSNDIEEEKYTYNSSDADEEGIISFKTHSIFDKINYKIEVYTRDEKCSAVPLKTIEFTTKAYNPYAINSICENKENLEYCDLFYDIKDMTPDDFVTTIQEYESSRTILAYIKKYYIYVFVPILVGTLIFLVKLIIFKRGNRNDFK